MFTLRFIAKYYSYMVCANFLTESRQFFFEANKFGVRPLYVNFLTTNLAFSLLYSLQIFFNNVLQIFLRLIYIILIKKIEATFIDDCEEFVRSADDHADKRYDENKFNYRYTN